MTQKFVTLPREVVEQAIDALYCTNSKEGSPTYNFELKAIKELRAALEQPQIQSGGIPPGWRLVPVEPTVEMLRAGCGSESPAMFRESLRRETDGQKTVEMVEKIIQRNLNSYRAMLAAAPQPQGEQEICCKIWSVNRIDDLGKIVDSSGRLIATVYGSQADKIVACHNSYTQQRHKREPLTHYEIHELFRRSWDDCQDGDEIKAFARAIEAAHNIK